MSEVGVRAALNQITVFLFFCAKLLPKVELELWGKG
jgi:hypothetical protein